MRNSGDGPGMCMVQHSNFESDRRKGHSNVAHFSVDQKVTVLHSYYVIPSPRLVAAQTQPGSGKTLQLPNANRPSPQVNRETVAGPYTDPTRPNAGRLAFPPTVSGNRGRWHYKARKIKTGSSGCPNY